MPVAVVALSAVSFSAGVTAFAAATTLAATVAAGATIVGSALTIVGTVTGNAKLAKIGGVLNIAGSLGTSLLSSASAGAEAAASAAGDTAGGAAADAASTAAADAAVQTFPVPTPPGGMETMGMEAAANAPSGMIDAVAGTGAPAAAPAAAMQPAAAGAEAAASTAGAASEAASTAASAAADVTSTTAASTAASAAPTPGMLDSVIGTSSSGPAATAFNTANTAAGQMTVNAFDAAGTAVGQANSIDAFRVTGGGLLDSIEAFPGAIDAANVANATASSPGMLSSLQGWAKANPELAKMALNGIGTAAGNLVPSSRDKAMMEAYRQQAAASQAQTEAQKRRALWGSGRTE